MVKRPLPLDPYGRSTLRNVLSPPAGYKLDRALGTAYSLDAETLVTIPLFAAGLGADELDKSVGISKIYELGSRVTLLVQGDRIAISRRWATSRPLLRLVGDVVVPCSIPGGSFHPKLLVLEFVSLDDPSKRLVRVVIATRNLTTDNSWDSMVVLDQSPAGGPIPGLADAVCDLANFVNDQKHAAVEHCRELGNALKNVSFQPIPGLVDLEVRLFHPKNGNAKSILEKIKGDDLLVISPFLRKGWLESLATQAGIGEKRRWLITRPVDIPDTAFTHYQVYKIADAALPLHTSDDTQRLSGKLMGLHAKIYLASSANSGTRIVVTSANATPSGWERNVEIAFTATTKSKALQVPAILAENASADEKTFRSLLEPITLGGVETSQKDPPWITSARNALASAIVTGTVRAGPVRLLEVLVNFSASGQVWPEHVSVTMHPFGYGDNCQSMRVENSRITGTVEIAAGIELTPFLSITLTHGDDASVDIVVAMQLNGDIDWDKEAARKSLAQLARPNLYKELLWYFGLRGESSPTGKPSEKKKSPKKKTDVTHLPILEKVLLRVHGPNAESEITTIDGLLAGLTDDPEDAGLAAMWDLVKRTLK